MPSAASPQDHLSCAVCGICSAAHWAVCGICGTAYWTACKFCMQQQSGAHAHSTSDAVHAVKLEVAMTAQTYRSKHVVRAVDDGIPNGQKNDCQPTTGHHEYGESSLTHWQRRTKFQSDHCQSKTPMSRFERVSTRASVKVFRAPKLPKLIIKH